MAKCEQCGAPGEPGTSCRHCRGYIEADIRVKTLWIIDTDSRSYSWRVIAETESQCRREFARMWNDWCKKTGADPYYWGHKGDKWADVEPEPVQIGSGYMDGELYR